MTKPFPATACQQSRQWVISGPLVGNFWSTRFALEHGIAGGAACAATHPLTMQAKRQRNASVEKYRCFTWISPSPQIHVLPSNLRSQRVRSKSPCLCGNTVAGTDASSRDLLGRWNGSAVPRRRVRKPPREARFAAPGCERSVLRGRAPFALEARAAPVEMHL